MKNQNEDVEILEIDEYTDEDYEKMYEAVRRLEAHDYETFEEQEELAEWADKLYRELCLCYDVDDDDEEDLND